MEECFMEPKRLYRSSTNNMLAGVCAGIAEYINLDPTIVRLLWIIFGCMGAGVIAYVVAAIIMPVRYER
jgi:phage shock protein C